MFYKLGAISGLDDDFKTEFLISISDLKPAHIALVLGNKFNPKDILNILMHQALQMSSKQKLPQQFVVKEACRRFFEKRAVDVGKRLEHMVTDGMVDASSGTVNLKAGRSYRVKLNECVAGKLTHYDGTDTNMPEGA